MVQLEDLGHKWTADCETVDEVMEKVILEQLLSTIPHDLQVWVAERKPATGSKGSQLANDYVQS